MDCHNQYDSEGNLDLTHFDSLQDLLRDREPWRKVLKQLKAGSMPPDGVDRPQQAETAEVIAWLERAVTHIDRSQPIDPGRVTIRRMNRTEYNNTIRDLFGVEMRLADEFPEDDVGYGFDNIGDVLAISPLRMEQYIRAAERLTACLLGKSEEFELDATTEAVFFERTKKTRNNSDRGLEMIPDTELYLDFEFPAPGEYEMRVYAWGVANPDEKDRSLNERWLEKDGQRIPPPGAKPAAAAELLCDDRSLGVIDVYPGSGTTALKTAYAVRFFAQAGQRRLRIRHRFSTETTPKEVQSHSKTPVRAPRLGVRRVGIRGPYSFNGGAKRTAPASQRPDAELWLAAERGENATPQLAEAHRLLLEVRPSSTLDVPEAAAKILRPLASQAFRRPITPAELDSLIGYVESQVKAGADFEEGIELAVQAILVSPRFLFRLELGPPPEDLAIIAPVDDYALASRLSYFLWASLPDERLFRLAAKGKLSEDAVLAAQVERMLRDPRSAAFVEGFFGQWLGLRKVLDVQLDRELYPEFSTQLKADLHRETMLLVDSLVRENRSAVELLTADYTFVNGELAKFYGIPGITKDADFQRTPLAGVPRQGVLTHGSLLMLTSYPNRTSPTRRGAWILETILGEEPPDPPADVPPLDETQAASSDLPLRRQLELHRSNATCASCHRVMDTIGFGFEHFDAIGKWRDQDGKQPIDAAGELPSGESFQSAQELVQILANREEAFVRHLSAKLLTFATGRGVEYYDRVAIDQIVENTRDQHFRLQDLVSEIVLSRPFRLTRSERETKAKE
ncbi:DUF1592 domain-containing protein [Lignipirellula cremea]|uniref:DUF1592 domain-containing protein n=1 Tax=Lignipirellula cremea TaxID=2528010 RepID=UPI0018D26B7F|nr:DUF1592 domain-containing protein [Lignipirellula cremea]